jgi:hypothetical protein
MSDEIRSLLIGDATPNVSEAVKQFHGADEKHYAAVVETLVKSLPKDRAASNTAVADGSDILPHLMNKGAARDLRNLSPTHDICLDAKASSSFGMGHRDRKIHETLDPLTRHGWQDVLDSMAVCYFETGEAFLEVVFDSINRKVVRGLYHVPSRDVWVRVPYGKPEHYSYRVQPAATHLANEFVPFGRYSEEIAKTFITQPKDGAAYSEIIHFRRGTNRSPYMGYPDYLSGVGSVELTQAMLQHEYDFHYNRGVPAFFFIVKGPLGEPQWQSLKNAIKAHQGPGNAHKSSLLHFPSEPESLDIKIERMSMEQRGDGESYAAKSEVLDLRTCTAHGMPPALANVLISGRMGANNEGPNALLTFQKRKLGQVQLALSSLFARTLGDVSFENMDGQRQAKVTPAQWLGEAFGKEDEAGSPIFHVKGNGFMTILDGLTLGAADTLATMREPLAGSGRDPSKGKLTGTDDRAEGDPRATR